jgi:hypothetical protein
MYMKLKCVKRALASLALNAGLAMGVTVAQGIKKTVAYKKQAGIGVPAIGAGGQLLRRRTNVFQRNADSYESDEIVSHHMSTGIAFGLHKVSGKHAGLLSPKTYADFFAAILEAAFVAGVSAVAASVTIAGAGPTFTVTRAAGSYLTDGFKIGDVVRLTVGALNAANINKNLWVTNVSALVLTVMPLNGAVLVAEGPVANTTVAVFNKKTKVPLTGHTKDFFTFEDWYADVAKSELWTDVRIGSLALGMPASGNCTIDMDFVGLNRTLAGAQALTAPTAETATSIMASVNGLIQVNGVTQGAVTGLQFSIANSAADSGPVVGADVAADVSTGRIKVSGQFTALFTDSVIQALYDNETVTSLAIAVTADNTAASDFMAFILSRIKITNDAPDDGEKAITRTYPFVAEYNIAGGATLTADQTIISVQDSAA